MLSRAVAIAALPLGLLAACDNPEVRPDTTYEQTLDSPVPQGDTGPEPVPDNDTIVGGADEQVDAAAAGDDFEIEEFVEEVE